MGCILAKAKASRDKQRQLGQFMTPGPLAERIVDGLALTPTSRILEPSFAQAPFPLPLIRRMVGLPEAPAGQTPQP